MTGGSFTEVSCLGMPSLTKWLQPENNRYKNPFGTEIALFRTSEGGMSRMAVSWDTPGSAARWAGSAGRGVRSTGSTRGWRRTCRPSFVRRCRPASGRRPRRFARLPDERIRHRHSQDRKPLVDIVQALNMTVAGIVAHQSALKNGELLKIPQYRL